jgi:hypothetical protein
MIGKLLGNRCLEAFYGRLSIDAAFIPVPPRQQSNVVLLFLASEDVRFL